MKVKSQHINVVKMLAYSSAPKREVARIANISEQTLYNWLKDPDFNKLYELHSGKYQTAIEEYQLNGDYEKFLSDLEISREDRHIISNLAYIDMTSSGVVDKHKSRVDNLLERCISLVEKRIESNTADDDLVIYLLDKYFTKLNQQS